MRPHPTGMTAGQTRAHIVLRQYMQTFDLESYTDDSIAGLLVTDIFEYVGPKVAEEICAKFHQAQKKIQEAEDTENQMGG